MTPEHQKQIDEINSHVEAYLVDKDEDALTWLILQFDPFIRSQSTRFCLKFTGVFDRESAIQEARIIFMDLVNEYEIGGVAYFNVYIQKKLPRRLWYQFSKEIKRRAKTISHADDQMMNLHTYDGVYMDKSDRRRLVENEDLKINVGDFSDELIADSETEAKINAIFDALYDEDLLTEREQEMFIRSVMNKEEQASIAKDWGLKRSTVSRIIAGAVEKITLATVRDKS